MTGSRVQVVIPMAGRGSRFAAEGYPDPKPFIPVFEGVWMVELVLANLLPRDGSAELVLVCQRDHLRDYDVTGRLSRFAHRVSVVELEGVTDGAACTVLMATSLLDPAEPLMIANSDQWLDIDTADYHAQVGRSSSSGTVMTMTADDPKWSYVGRDAAGKVERVVEKEVVSSEATVGVYTFARCSGFVSAAEQMIEADDRVNGEFYVAPTYNYLLRDGAEIDTIHVGDVGSTMWGLGTPEDLEAFLGSEAVAARAHHQVTEWPR